MVSSNIQSIENDFITIFVNNIIQLSISNISFNFNNEIYENSTIKKWIKQIPFNKTVSIEKYNNKEYFKPIAEIVLDIEQKNGKKQRNTVIRFIPKIQKVENCSLFVYKHLYKFINVYCFLFYIIFTL